MGNVIAPPSEDYYDRMSNEWSTGLFNCCTDAHDFFACWCLAIPPCHYHLIGYLDAGNNYQYHAFKALCGSRRMLDSYCVSAVCRDVFCLCSGTPFAVAGLRKKMAHGRYHIDEHRCTTWAVAIFCFSCALSQMLRERRFQDEFPTRWSDEGICCLRRPPGPLDASLSRGDISWIPRGRVVLLIRTKAKGRMGTAAFAVWNIMANVFLFLPMFSSSTQTTASHSSSSSGLLLPPEYDTREEKMKRMVAKGKTVPVFMWNKCGRCCC